MLLEVEDAPFAPGLGKGLITVLIRFAFPLCISNLGTIALCFIPTTALHLTDLQLLCFSNSTGPVAALGIGGVLARRSIPALLEHPRIPVQVVL